MLYCFYRIDVNIDQRMRDRIGQILVMQSDAMHATMNANFSVLHTAADRMGDTYAHTSDLFDAQCRGLLDSLHEYTGFARILITDSSGVGFTDDGLRCDLSGRDYLPRVLAGESVLTHIEKAAPNCDSRAVLAVPILHEGQAVGMLVGSLQMDQVCELLFSRVYDGQGVHLIFDRSGRLLCNTDSYLSGRFSTLQTLLEDTTYMEGSTDAILNDFAHECSGSLRVRFHGQEYTAAYRPLGLGDWVLGYAVPQEYVNDEYKFFRHYEGVLFIVSALGVGLFLLCVLVRNHRDRVALSLQAKTDSLSGLLNRAAAEDTIDTLLHGRTFGSTGTSGALLLMDLDHFKDVNDTYGHQMGDRLIEQVGKTLLASFRASDCCCRIGGDEFLVFLPSLTDRELLIARAQMLCRKLPTLLHDEIASVVWGVSIGIAIAPQDGNSFDTLYHCADKALYAAKSTGRAHYCFYDSPQSS